MFKFQLSVKLIKKKKKKAFLAPYITIYAVMPLLNAEGKCLCESADCIFVFKMIGRALS